MMLSKAVVAPLALLVTACVTPDSGVEAPYSAALQLPDDITLSWNTQYNVPFLSLLSRARAAAALTPRSLPTWPPPVLS